jgi:hypothetical protein
VAGVAGVAGDPKVTDAGCPSRAPCWEKTEPEISFRTEAFTWGKARRVICNHVIPSIKIRYNSLLEGGRRQEFSLSRNCNLRV